MLSLTLALALVSTGTALDQTHPPQPPSQKKPARGPQGPAVFQAPTNAATPTATPGATFVYDQKPAPSRPPLVPEDQATNIVDRFKVAYAVMGRPRFLIVASRNPQEPLSNTNAAPDTPLSQQSDAKPVPAEKEIRRDVERHFGRPLRLAGVHLVDQELLPQTLAPEALRALTRDSAQPKKDREILSQIADVLIEVLVSSKPVVAVELSGQDSTYAAPDIQATALDLKDGKVLAQASTTDLYGGNPSPVIVRNYSAQAITEATALALMEDFLLEIEIQK